MAEQLSAVAESQLVGGVPTSWLAQLRLGSFRGVAFHTDSVEWTAGDNVVLREYPFQDLPTVFRMGAASQELKFSAYVIGDDYHLQRAALMDALTGEGVLVHPTAGTMRAFVAGKFTVREAPTTEGGLARFDLTFVLAEPRRYPVGAVNSQAGATERADAAKEAAADEFAARWSVVDKPGWVAETAVARVQAALAGHIERISSAAAGLNDYLAEVNTAYRTLVNGLESIVRAPRQLADAVLQLYRLPVDLSQAARADFREAFRWSWDLTARLPRRPFEVSVMPPVGLGLVMYGTGTVGDVPPSTGQRQVAEITAAGDALFEILGTAAWVQASAELEVLNYDEALQLRADVNEQLLRLMQRASAAPPPPVLPDSNLHTELQALHGAALADLQARSRDLVRLSSYTPESWQPVWYISHRLYGTAAYADEILAMNPHIEHPLLVPPGRALRIVRHE